MLPERRRDRRARIERTMHIRKDDQVEVITGDDKGTPDQRRFAKVLRVLTSKNKIVVEGVNRVYKHLKPSAKNQQGGRLSKEMPIDVSNVQLVCPKCNRGVRIGHRFSDDGQKQRYCRKCGQNLGSVGPRKGAHAAAATKKP
jgi:large subunit ribosomal protein L24